MRAKLTLGFVREPENESTHASVRYMCNVTVCFMRACVGVCVLWTHACDAGECACRVCVCVREGEREREREREREKREREREY